MIFNDKKRFTVGIILIAISLVLLVLAVGGSEKIITFLSNFLVWIIIFHIIGLGIAAVSASRDNNKTFIYEYFLLYPITLLASSSVLFLLISKVQLEGGTLHFITASISLYLGLNIDHLSGWILRN